jgi:predicted transcriptional regulator
MKTAISLPDELFGEAEHLAAQLRISRSELYVRALKEFLTRHAPDPVTQALDTLCDDLDTSPDGFAVRSARRTIARGEW